MAIVEVEVEGANLNERIVLMSMKRYEALLDENLEETQRLGQEIIDSIAKESLGTLDLTEALQT